MKILSELAVFQWNELTLNGLENKAYFNFQIVLKANGDIVFTYKTVPKLKSLKEFIR